MKLLVLTQVVLAALLGAFLTERARGRDGKRELFSEPGYPSRMDRLLLVVAAPILGTFLVHLARGTMVEPKLLRYGQAAILFFTVWKCVWSASNIPADYDAGMRREALLWYRRVWGWTVFGLLGVTLAAALASPPNDGLFGGGFVVGILITHWCFRHFVSLAFPVTGEQETLERESERAGIALFTPVRFCLGAAVLGAEMVLGILWRHEFRVGLEQWLVYAPLGLWLFGWRARVAANTIRKTLPGHRLFSVRTGLRALRERSASDRELRVGQGDAFEPQVLYRRSTEPSHAAIDIFLQGLVLTMLLGLPLLALAPQIAFGPLPAFWVVTAASLPAAAVMSRQGVFRTLAAPAALFGLGLSAYLCPAVADPVPVLSCALLFAMCAAALAKSDPGPMAALGRPGRWWIADLPRAWGAPRCRSHPVAELPWAGWLDVTAESDVPWAPLWRPLVPCDRARPAVFAAAAALLAIGLWPAHRFLHEISPVHILWASGDRPIDVWLQEGRVAEADAVATQAVAIAPGSVWAWVSKAQAAHDDGRGADRDRALETAQALLGGWVTQKTLRLQMGRARERALADRAAAVPIPAAWAGRPHVARDLELSRLVSAVRHEYLGYACASAAARRAWKLAGDAARAAPENQAVRSIWLLRALQAHAAEARDSASPRQPWTALQILSP